MRQSSLGQISLAFAGLADYTYVLGLRKVPEKVSASCCKVTLKFSQGVLRKRRWPDSLQCRTPRQKLLRTIGSECGGWLARRILPNAVADQSEHFLQARRARASAMGAHGTDFGVLRRPEMPRCCLAKRRFLRSFAGSKPPLENMEKFGLRMEIKYRPSPALRVKVWEYALGLLEATYCKLPDFWGLKAERNQARWKKFRRVELKKKLPKAEERTGGGAGWTKNFPRLEKFEVEKKLFPRK